MPASERCSISKELLRQTGLVDPFGDSQVGFAGVVEQFGEFQAYGRILCEQQPFEHRLVDSDHLLQINSGEVHGGARMLAEASITAEISWNEAHYAAASNFDGASQKPSVRNRTAVSVLAEIALSGGVSSLTSSMYGSG